MRVRWKGKVKARAVHYDFFRRTVVHGTIVPTNSIFKFDADPLPALEVRPANITDRS